MYKALDRVCTYIQQLLGEEGLIVQVLLVSESNVQQLVPIHDSIYIHIGIMIKLMHPLMDRTVYHYKFVG